MAESSLPYPTYPYPYAEHHTQLEVLEAKQNSLRENLERQESSLLRMETKVDRLGERQFKILIGVLCAAVAAMGSLVAILLQGHQAHP